MIPLASLIRGPVAAVVARYGRPVTLARRTEPQALAAVRTLMLKLLHGAIG